MLAWKIAKNQFLRKFLKIALAFVQRLRLKGIEIERVVSDSFSINLHKKPNLFNLDVHIAVIGDLLQGFHAQAKITRFSISHHNWVIRKILKLADPVEIINEHSWKQMGDGPIFEFADRYRSFLRTFDGFIVCYPIPMVEAYAQFGKPIFLQTATRYEAPYTNQRSNWIRLNSTLVSLQNTGLLHAHANNQGDKDYFSINTGIEPTMLPSICDYTRVTWEPSRPDVGIICSDDNLTREAEKYCPNVKNLRQLFPHGYTYKQLASLSGIVFIPYQISTMTLFECSTAGIPVYVPSKQLLRDWYFANRQEVLSQLSFFQVLNIETNDLSESDPNNVRANLDWWIDRADFYNENLMPNVQVFEDFDNLRRLLETRIESETLRNTTIIRNEELKAIRASHLRTFLETL